MKKLSILFLGALIGYSALAQDFEVSPVLMRFDANPGEIQSRTINIVNHSVNREKFVFNLADYTIDQYGQKQSVPAGSTPRSCAAWITINPSFIELNPNESAQIEVLMQVPRDGFQSKWGIINVQPAKEQTGISADKEMATGVILVPRIAVLVQQSPQSNENYEGIIQGMTEVTKPGDDNRIFEATIINSGDKVLEADVKLAVANIMTAEEKTYNPVKVTVYPDSERIVHLILPEVLLPGQYAIAAFLDYGHRRPIEVTQMMLEVK
jgi:hypothetical protein